MKFCIERIQVIKFFITLLILFIPSVLLNAAGVVFVYENGKWQLFDQTAQFCAINLIDGTQKMVIGVSLGDGYKGEKLAWFFPVPAVAEQVVISEAIELPILHGMILEDRARDLISFSLALNRQTQIYYAFFESLWFSGIRYVNFIFGHSS